MQQDNTPEKRLQHPGGVRGEAVIVPGRSHIGTDRVAGQGANGETPLGVAAVPVRYRLGMGLLALELRVLELRGRSHPVGYVYAASGPPPLKPGGLPPASRGGQLQISVADPVGRLSALPIRMNRWPVAVRTPFDVRMATGIHGGHWSVQGTKLRFWVAPSLGNTHSLIRGGLSVAVVQGMVSAARWEGGLSQGSAALGVLGQGMFPAVSLAVGVESERRCGLGAAD